MSYLINITDKKPDGMIAQALADTIRQATEYFKPDSFGGFWSKGGLAVTVLAPRHVAASNNNSGTLNGGVAGSSAWGVTAVTASTMTNWININVDSRAYQIVTGIFNLTPNAKITAIKPILNGQEMPLIDISEMYNYVIPRAYFSEPYIISPTNTHQIQVLSPVTLAGVPSEQIGLTGFIVGKRAYAIATS